MGAWIAFELLRTLRREGRPMPVHFFASGRPAPQLQDQRSAAHLLADGDLVQAVARRFGGIPAAILAEPELLELLLPILRSDLKAVETYVYAPGPPLSCPITAFGGLEDSQVSLADLERWREQTSQTFNLRRFPGAHFYFNDGSSSALCRAIYISLHDILVRSGRVL
jgi:medium-chain acyl-[acyl-carrier-protein] hydrolase